MRMKGSYTVEMALLMPVILGVIYGVICISFLMFDTVTLHTACYEGIIAEREAEVKALLIMREPDVYAEGGGHAVSLVYTGEADIGILRLIGINRTGFRIRVSGKVNGSEPVRFIRTCRAAEKLLKGE